MAGRRLGKRQLARHPKQPLHIGVAESGIFALLGLLVAFTFSGACQRFEDRKIFIIEEANAIKSAYLRIDLLDSKTQAPLRKEFKEYIDSRVAIFKDIDFRNYKIIHPRIAHSQMIQRNIWNEAVQSLKQYNNFASQDFLTALTRMFEIADKQAAMTMVHPPILIYVLLLFLSLTSALLIGYSTAETEIKKSLHIFSYIAITSITLYLIVDLELPRVGLIRVTPLDQILVETKNNL